MKLKNGLNLRGRASRERGSEWRECDGKINLSVCQVERLTIITIKAVTLGMGLAQIEYPKVLLGRDVLNGWPTMKIRS